MIPWSPLTTCPLPLNILHYIHEIWKWEQKKLDNLTISLDWCLIDKFKSNRLLLEHTFYIIHCTLFAKVVGEVCVFSTIVTKRDPQKKKIKLNLISIFIIETKNEKSSYHLFVNKPSTPTGPRAWIRLVLIPTYQ